ncbi:MAG TPA: hypothetical protein VGB73_15640 [Pyrinomonadaceae bacterium]
MAEGACTTGALVACPPGCCDGVATFDDDGADVSEARGDSVAVGAGNFPPHRDGVADDSAFFVSLARSTEDSVSDSCAETTRAGMTVQSKMRSVALKILFVR